jgi:dCMP deaminase
MSEWHEYFIKMARLVSTKSKDPSTKVGAVIVGEDNEVLSTGFNGFPRGVAETVQYPKGYAPSVSDLPPGKSPGDLLDRWERPQKYQFVEHAERNAIYNAARQGIRLKGSRMYLNWEPCPCVECTKAVIQAGIAQVIGPNKRFPGKGDHWQLEQDVAQQMLNESGVGRIKVNMK